MESRKKPLKKQGHKRELLDPRTNPLIRGKAQHNLADRSSDSDSEVEQNVGHDDSESDTEDTPVSDESGTGMINSMLGMDEKHHEGEASWRTKLGFNKMSRVVEVADQEGSHDVAKINIDLLNAKKKISDLPEEVQAAAKEYKWAKKEIHPGTRLVRFARNELSDSSDSSKFGKWYMSEPEFSFLRALFHARLDDPTGERGLVKKLYERQKLLKQSGQFGNDFFDESKGMALLTEFLEVSGSMRLLDKYRDSVAVLPEWNPFENYQTFEITEPLYAFVSKAAPQQKQVEGGLRLSGGGMQYYFDELTADHIKQVANVKSDVLQEQVESKSEHLALLAKCLTVSKIDPETPGYASIKKLADEIQHERNAHRKWKVIADAVALGPVAGKAKPSVAEDTSKASSPSKRSPGESPG